MQIWPKFERQWGKFKRYYKRRVFYRFSLHRAKFRIYERFWKIKVVFALFVALRYNIFCWHGANKTQRPFERIFIRSFFLLLMLEFLPEYLL